VRPPLEVHVQDQSDTPGLVMTDWLAIGVTQGYDADGDGISAVQIILDGGQPYYRLLGLLDEAKTRLRADLLDDLSGD
jgi:hypothetical protein